MKKFYAFILGFTAILLAITAAYFSVFGLSKLFIGASLSVIIMAATLEFSKIVIVSSLHQFWNKIAKGLRGYLVFGVVILMIITSVGIYGFLTSAYSKVSSDFEKMGGNVGLLDKKIEIKKEERDRYADQIKTKNDRIISLTELRKTQEVRLDSLYNKGWVAMAKKTENVISQADDNIAALTTEINSISVNIEGLNDSISKYETIKLEVNNSDVASEMGPLKYISKLTGVSMDIVVNWLILLLIVVFDPMAVALVLFTSSLIKMIKESKDAEHDSKKDTFKEKVKYISDEQGNFKLQNEEIIPETIMEEVTPEINMGDDSKETEQILNLDNQIIKEQIETIPKEDLLYKISQDIIIPDILTAQTNSVDVLMSEEKNLNLQLLDFFYDKGNSKNGDIIPAYADFKKNIDNKLLNISDKEIKDFLLICNLFKITEFKKDLGYFNKSYEDAIYLISKI